MQTEPFDYEAYVRRLEAAAKDTFWGLLGCVLEEINEQRVVVSLQIAKHHLNILGILHGGVHASLLDNTMGIAVMAACPHNKIVTTHLALHYVSPQQEGKIVYVTGKVIHQSKRIITAQGEIKDGTGKLSSFGTGSFQLIN
jgi:uncharacterized protein (TIGR00369 family)